MAHKRTKAHIKCASKVKELKTEIKKANKKLTKAKVSLKRLKGASDVAFHQLNDTVHTLHTAESK